MKLFVLIYFSGSNIEGFQLDKVFVAVTPGLTTELDTNDNMVKLATNIPTDCMFEKFATHHPSIKVRSYPSLAKNKDSVRKNREKSFKHYSRYTNSINCEINSLTPHGIAQLIQEGEFLSTRYRYQLTSLQKAALTQDAANAPGDKVLFQTLSAFLHGLLDEEQFIQSRIRKSPVHFTSENGIDPELHHLVESSFHSESHILKGGKQMFSKERLNFGKNKITPAKHILSQIASRVCEGDKKSALKMLLNEINSVFHMSDAFNSYLSSNSLFKKYAHSRTLPFFNMLFQWLNLDDEISSNDDLKIVSIDDLMMMSVLTTVSDVVDKHQLPASRLVLEVFRPTTANISKLSDNQKVVSNRNLETLVRESISVDPKFVRILYNGDVITSTLQSCQNSPLSNQGLCDFNSLIKEIRNQEFIDFKNEL